MLTAASAARIAELMSKAPEGAIGVKLSTPRRGCSGLAYSVDYVTEAVAFDEKIETTPGVVSFIYGLLADNSNNVWEEMSCWTDFMVIIEQKDAARAMRVLSLEEEA